MMLALLFGWSMAQARTCPDAATLQAAWEAYRPALTAEAVYPFRFTEKEWATVAKCEVARRREKLKGTDRVLGLVWLDADIDTAWVAVQDPHIEIVDGFVEETLPGSTFENKVVYQSIDLPWPLATRQWVIRVVNNGALRTKTNGHVWERTWDLDPARSATHEKKKGVWLDVNDGGWFFAKAAGGTLVGYHARTVVGGIVPDEIATRWSFGTIGKMLRRVAERVPWVREHYVEDHVPVLRPGATPIPPG
ncbi:MAG: hypothetical protein AAGA48_21785 [Myxococcota bacterium]